MTKEKKKVTRIKKTILQNPTGKMKNSVTVSIIKRLGSDHN